MRVILQVIKGPQKGERFVFDSHEAFVIGRKKNKRVQFRIPNDKYLSRYHTLIEISPPHCFLRDLNSTNGTWVNGEKKKQADLKNGDIIRGGRTAMRVTIEESNTPKVEKRAASSSQRQVASRSPTAEALPQPSERLSAACSGLDWDTKVFDERPALRGASPLRCSVCSNLAADTYLSDLTETTILDYVCAECRAKHQDPEQPVPNYQRLKTLARGALGPAYKARRISSEKLAVLKVLSRDLAGNPQASKTFLRQMLLAAGLDHPHIVPVIEMGQAGPDLWIASEYVDGLDARQLARKLGGRVPLVDAVEIVCQILQALQYAHDQNMVHRDVKPSNILVVGQPGAYTACLSDFGLMRNMDEAGVSGITRKGEVRGTVPFMPPEQVLDCRFVKPEGDIYAAAATLYWMITGELVRNFEATAPNGDVKDPYLVILEDPIITIRHRDPSIPESVATVIETALLEEPEDRYAKASEMENALRAAIG